MARKEKQWEVEDKNLRTMGTENSRQIQIRIYSHHFLRAWCPFTPPSICMQAKHTNRVSWDSSVVAIPRSLNLGWNFLSSGFVLNLFHICFLGCRNLRLREWWFEVTLGRGFCCFARKLPSEVTSPFLPFILCWNFFIWICSIFVPSLLSGLLESEVTGERFLFRSKAPISLFSQLYSSVPIRGHISLSPIHPTISLSVNVTNTTNTKCTPSFSTNNMRA